MAQGIVMQSEKAMIKKVPAWAMIPGRVDAVVTLAASGRTTKKICEITGMAREDVCKILARKGVKESIADLQESQRLQLTGRSVAVAQRALGVLARALACEDISLLRRAQLAVRIVEAQAKAQAAAHGPTVNVQTNVAAASAESLLARIQGQRPERLTDAELELAATDPTIVHEALMADDDDPPDTAR